MTDIVIKDLCKSFGENEVIKNYSAVIPAGSRFCLMGGSGTGKTTLLNLVLGLLKPDGGKITGVPSNVSAVFQEDRLAEYMSAVGNVKLVTGKSVSENAVVSLLGELGLSGSEHAPVATLSGGMKRRVAIARALAAKSELVILDEPFSGLDDSTRAATIGVINKYTAGKTLIAVTHDISDASALNAEIITL